MSIKEPIQGTAYQLGAIEMLRAEAEKLYHKSRDLKQLMYSAERQHSETAEQARRLEHFVKCIISGAALTWITREGWDRDKLKNVTHYDFVSVNYRFSVMVSTRTDTDKKPYYIHVSGYRSNNYSNPIIFKDESEDNANGHPYKSSKDIIRRYKTQAEQLEALDAWKMHIINKYADDLLKDYAFMTSSAPEELDRANALEHMATATRPCKEDAQ